MHGRLRWLCVLIAVFFILIMASGCTSSQKTAEKSPAPAETGAEKSPAPVETGKENVKAGESFPSILTMATNPVGSMFNNIGSGIAATYGKHLPTQVKVNPVSGHSVWLPMAEKGDVDTAIINSYDAKLAYLGQEDYAKVVGEKGANISIIAVGAPGLNGVIVSKQSGIKTGKDLKGKRYAGIYANSKGVTAQAMAFLANQGLTEKDVKMMTVPGVAQGVQGITDGRIDGAGSAIIGMGVITELDAGKGARFLSFDKSPEAVERMLKEYPYGFIVEVKPGPGKDGIVDDPTYMMGWDIYMVAGAKVSEDVAYQMTKTLWENYKELGDYHPMLKEWTQEKFVSSRAVIPYHPGAVKFYKEVGAWNQDMDKLQQKLLNEKK